MLLSDLEDGSSVFVDANIFIYHFSKESKLNPASSKFLERIEEGKIKGFTSVAIIQEVGHRMITVEAASILPPPLASNDSDFERVNFIKLHKPSASMSPS